MRALASPSECQLVLALLLLLHVAALIVLGHAGRCEVCSALLHRGTCTLEPHLPLPLSLLLVLLCTCSSSKAR